MAINKVVFDAKVLLDLTEDTVTPDTLIEGVTAHGKDGSEIVGTFSVAEEISEQDALISQIKTALENKGAVDLSEEINTQDTLISQIKTALENKGYV